VVGPLGRRQGEVCVEVPVGVEVLSIPVVSLDGESGHVFCAARAPLERTAEVAQR
jgi:hypothetical protein